MTPEIWKVLSDTIKAMPDRPSWLNEQAGMGYEAVLRLPVVDEAEAGQHALPIVEEKAVTPDYLNFLREQILLNPRGPEWSALLKKRLAALEPFVDKQLESDTFSDWKQVFAGHFFNSKRASLRAVPIH